MVNARLAIGSVCVLSSLAGGCATTAPPEIGPAGGPRIIDARADEELQRMSSYLASLDRLRLEAEITYEDYLVESQKVQYARTTTIEVMRPDRCRGTVAGDRENRRYWYDGQQLVMLDTDKNVYSTVDVPGTIDEMVATMSERYGVSLPIGDLISTQAYDWLMAEVLTARYVGRHRAAGVACHHLAFEQAAVDWQLWIEDGEHPFPRKLLVVYKDTPGMPQYEATFTRCDPAPSLNDSDFVIALPPGAVRVEFEPAAGSQPPKPQGQ